MSEAKPKVDVAKIIEALGVGRDEAIAKTIKSLTDAEKLEFITYVYPIEDEKLAMMRSIAERYNYTWLKKWIDEKLLLRTSLMGWRSNQLTNIASEKRKEESSKFSLRWIFGRGRKKDEGVEEFE